MDLSRGGGGGDLRGREDVLTGGGLQAGAQGAQPGAGLDVVLLLPLKCHLQSQFNDFKPFQGLKLVIWSRNCKHWSVSQ